MQETANRIREYCKYKFKEEMQDTIYRRLARDALFEEEERIGKCFFQWDADECEQFFNELKVDSTKSRNFREKASWSYITYLIVYYRELHDFNMQQTGVYYLNPLRDKRFTSMDRRGNDAPLLTSVTVERLGYAAHECLVEEEADFTELLLWMFYSGFYDYSEIVELQEEDVDIDHATARIGNRTVKLKDRCIELMHKNRETVEYHVYLQTNVMFQYHGSYLRFPFRLIKNKINGADPYEYTLEKFEALSVYDIGKKLSNRMVKLRKETNEYISYDRIYYLGLYEHLIDRCGVEKARFLLESMGNRSKREESKELRQYFAEYGAKLDESIDFYRAKHTLRQFLP